jgi:hypothetical protein
LSIRYFAISNFWAASPRYAVLDAKVVVGTLYLFLVSSFVWQSMQYSAHGRAIKRIWSIGFPQLSQMPQQPRSNRSSAKLIRWAIWISIDRCVESKKLLFSAFSQRCKSFSSLSLHLDFQSVVRVLDIVSSFLQSFTAPVYTKWSTIAWQRTDNCKDSDAFTWQLPDNMLTKKHGELLSPPCSMIIEFSRLTWRRYIWVTVILPVVIPQGILLYRHGNLGI